MPTSTDSRTNWNADRKNKQVGPFNGSTGYRTFWARELAEAITNQNRTKQRIAQDALAMALPETASVSIVQTAGGRKI
jgi:hypothetical protein